MVANILTKSIRHSHLHSQLPTFHQADKDTTNTTDTTNISNTIDNTKQTTCEGQNTKKHQEKSARLHWGSWRRGELWARGRRLPAGAHPQGALQDARRPRGCGLLAGAGGGDRRRVGCRLARGEADASLCQHSARGHAHGGVR